MEYQVTQILQTEFTYSVFNITKRLKVQLFLNVFLHVSLEEL